MLFILCRLLFIKLSMRLDHPQRQQWCHNPPCLLKTVFLKVSQISNEHLNLHLTRVFSRVLPFIACACATSTSGSRRCIATTRRSHGAIFPRVFAFIGCTSFDPSPTATSHPERYFSRIAGVRAVPGTTWFSSHSNGARSTTGAADCSTVSREVWSSPQPSVPNTCKQPSQWNTTNQNGTF